MLLLLPHREDSIPSWSRCYHSIKFRILAWWSIFNFKDKNCLSTLHRVSSSLTLIQAQRPSSRPFLQIPMTYLSTRGTQDHTTKKAEGNPVEAAHWEDLTLESKSDRTIWTPPHHKAVLKIFHQVFKTTVPYESDWWSTLLRRLEVCRV